MVQTAGGRRILNQYGVPLSGHRLTGDAIYDTEEEAFEQGHITDDWLHWTVNEVYLAFTGWRLCL
jgi:hypothetical protein